MCIKYVFFDVINGKVKLSKIIRPCLRNLKLKIYAFIEKNFFEKIEHIYVRTRYASQLYLNASRKLQKRGARYYTVVRHTYIFAHV